MGPESRGYGVVPAVVALLLSLGASGVAAQNLTISLSAAPPGQAVISTTSRDDRSLVVASGQTVSLTRARGREEQLRAVGGWFLAQFEEQPRDAERIEVTPRLLDDGRIEARIETLHKDGAASQSYRSVLVVEPGEWTRLYVAGAGSVPAPRGTRSYSSSAGEGASTGGRSSGSSLRSSAQASGDALYLRIDP